jgi:Cu-Zn family superoxide dismutase
MNKVTLCAIVSMSALPACNWGGSETGTTSTLSTSAGSRASARDAAVSSLHVEVSPRPAPNTAGRAADASVVPKVAARLDPRDAEATFVAAPEIKLRGEARLNQRADGVLVDVELSEGPPGTHGIHIHRKADCSDIRRKSMGEHLAPENEPHGLPFASAHHLGDLGNIEIAPDGTADFKIVVPDANLRKGDDHSLLNRSVVIHEQRDVGTGQSGGSGAPIACAAFVAR